jgi:hypothetical protein
VRGGWLILVILFWCGAARADYPAHPEVGFSGGIGGLVMAPYLGNSTFRSEGQPFEHKGRDLGLGRPPMLGGQFRFGVVTRHVEVGAQLVFTSGTLNSPDPAITPLVGVESISSLGAGGHVVGVLPLGPAALTFGPDIGVRSFSVPLVGFPKYPCQTRSGPSQCAYEASTTQFYVQPQVGIIFTTRPVTKYGSSLFVQLWAGGDVVPGPSYAFGIMFGGAMDHNRMAD